MNIFLRLLLALLSLSGTRAATVTYTTAVATVIPDNDASGVLQTIDVSNSGLASLDSVTLSLATTGGWNGDLYAYLVHDGVLTVLLNRPGRSLSVPDGSHTSGIAILLDDAAPTDVHAAPGALSGTFQPDGRFIDPSLSLDTTPRTDLLADFTPTSPNGTWRLFIADVAGGDEATLVSWSLSLTGPSVPEPTSIGLLSFASLLVMRRYRAYTAQPLLLV